MISTNEMVTLDSKISGLPTTVWLNDRGIATNHSKYYIKVLPKNPHAITYDSVEMSISQNPVLRNPIPKDFKLSNYDIETVSLWVKSNETLLRMICDKTLDFDKLLSHANYKQPRTALNVKSMKNELAKRALGNHNFMLRLIVGDNKQNQKFDYKIQINDLKELEPKAKETLKTSLANHKNLEYGKKILGAVIKDNDKTTHKFVPDDGQNWENAKITQVTSISESSPMPGARWLLEAPLDEKLIQLSQSPRITGNAKLDLNSPEREDVSELCKELAKVKGVALRGITNNKAILLSFDSVESLNCFMWAMCNRFGSIGKGNGWKLEFENGDTDITSKKINATLRYDSFHNREPQDFQEAVKTLASQVRKMTDKGAVDIRESKETDALIAFGGKSPSVAFYPNKPKSLNLYPRSPYSAFALTEKDELRFYCVFYPPGAFPPGKEWIESDPLFAARQFIHNSKQFARMNNGEPEIADIGKNGYGKAYPFATFYEKDNYEGYEEFEKEQELGKPYAMEAGDELNKANKESNAMNENLKGAMGEYSDAEKELRSPIRKIHEILNKIHETGEKNMNGKQPAQVESMIDAYDKFDDSYVSFIRFLEKPISEGKTFKSSPASKNNRWKLSEDDIPPTAQPAQTPAPATTTAPEAAPAEPPKEGEPEPTVEEVVAEFITSTKGKFPRLETSELEQIVMNAFKQMTDTENAEDTVPMNVAEKVVKEAMTLCETYNSKKALPGIKTKFSK